MDELGGLKPSVELADFSRVKLHDAGHERKQRIVFRALYILTGSKLCPALANDNPAGFYGLAAEYFNPESFGDGVAAKLCTPSCFCMCHRFW